MSAVIKFAPAQKLTAAKYPIIKSSQGVQQVAHVERVK